MQKADQARHHPALGLVAVEIFAGVQRYLLAVTVLQHAADKLRHEDLVLHRADLQPDLLVKDAVDHSRDPRNHGVFFPINQCCW